MYDKISKPLTILNRCALKYHEHYACQKLLWMPLESCLQVSVLLAGIPITAFLAPSWVVACNEPFIYHNTNFHGGFVINCISVEKDGFWGDFCFIYLFSILFLWIVVLVSCSVFTGVIVLGLKKGRLFWNLLLWFHFKAPFQTFSLEVRQHIFTSAFAVVSAELSMHLLTLAVSVNTSVCEFVAVVISFVPIWVHGSLPCFYSPVCVICM